MRRKRDAAGDLALPERPIGIPASFDDYTKLMLDLQLLAFQTDTTRVFSMVLAREVSNRAYPHIGVPDQHHAASHHRNDAGLIEKKTKIDAYHVSLLGYLAEKMRATPDGDGSLLDQSLLLYGAGMGDGNLHQHTDLPCVMLGKLGGTVAGGQHIAYPSGTPMTNLLLTVLDKVGVSVATIGDSTGAVAGLPHGSLALASILQRQEWRMQQAATLQNKGRTNSTRPSRNSSKRHRIS